MSTLPLNGVSTAATAASLNAPTPTASSSSSGLSQTNFLKLLMAQMQNQDPSSPTSPTDYVTQMAQFSSVQGITQLNQNITNLLVMQGLGQGVNMIGKTVSYTTSYGQTASGTVSAVSMVGGQPQLVINNTYVGLNQIQSVQASARRSTTTTATAGSNS
jgi:flagellar basal-body rod modification protein FlgD